LRRATFRAWSEGTRLDATQVLEPRFDPPLWYESEPAADRCCFFAYTLILARRQEKLEDSSERSLISLRAYKGISISELAIR
jgi:hypothetical protein